MSQSGPASEIIADAPPASAPSSTPLTPTGKPAQKFEAPEHKELFLSLFTATVAAHLLVIGIIGQGIPQPAKRPVRAPAPPPTAAIVEEVKVEAEPPPPQPVEQQETPPPPPDAPSEAAPLDLPPLPEVQPIAAVSAAVPVSFGIEPNGAYRLVNDASRASGAVGGRRHAAPISLDSNSKYKLLMTTPRYPAEAKRRRQSGTVVVIFRSTKAGDISDVKIYQSSGFDSLDQASLEAVKHATWPGEPGLYTKSIEWNLTP